MPQVRLKSAGTWDNVLRKAGETVKLPADEVARLTRLGIAERVDGDEDTDGLTPEQEAVRQQDLRIAALHGQVDAARELDRLDAGAPERQTTGRSARRALER